MMLFNNIQYSNIVKKQTSYGPSPNQVGYMSPFRVLVNPCKTYRNNVYMFYRESFIMYID